MCVDLVEPATREVVDHVWVGGLLWDNGDSCNGDIYCVPGGVICTPDDLRVRLFGSYGLVDVPPDCMSV